MTTVTHTTATKSSTLVWAALVIFTVLSFALGGEEMITHGTLAAAVVIGIGAIKVRLVGLYFMELRSAPFVLRAAFEVYCAVLFVVLLGTYALA